MFLRNLHSFCVVSFPVACVRYERKKPGIQDTATRLEEKLKDERRKEVEAQIERTAQEIRALKSEVHSIRAGKQDSDITQWFNEQKAAEMKDLQLTAQALQYRKSKLGSGSPPPPDVDAETFAKIEKVLKKLTQLKFSEPFRWPVTPDDLDEDDNYYGIIKNPTDLTSIRIKLQQGLIKSKQDLWRCDKAQNFHAATAFLNTSFHRELSLLFDNAFKFNEVGSNMYVIAQNFREHAIKEIETIFSTDSVTSSDGISTRYGRKK